MRRALLAALVLTGSTALAACGSSAPASTSSAPAVTPAALTAAVARLGGTLNQLSASGRDTEARIAVPVPGGATAEGWVAWPTTAPIPALVLFAHGCCGVPSNAKQTALIIAQRVSSMVVEMDYRLADQYRPDVAAQDLDVANTLLRKAIPSVERTVALGQSEGGAVTGLLVAGHPGAVDTWIDVSGAVDLGAVRTQLVATAKLPDGGGDPQGVAHLLSLVDQAVGDPPDAAKVAAYSPGLKPAALKGVRQVVIIHASGDLIVPAPESVTLANALRAEGVKTQLRILDPGPGQPVQSAKWHTAEAVADLGLAAAAFAVDGDTLLGPSTQRSPAPLN